MTKEVADEELVQVAVPREYLLAVYGLLAQLSAQSQQKDVDYDFHGANESEWSVADLKRFASRKIRSIEIIGQVLDVLAPQPEVWVSTTELEEKTGVPRANLKGAFSALTRHLNAYFAGRGWMMNTSWGMSLGLDHLPEVHYRMTSEQAARWLESRKDQ